MAERSERTRETGAAKTRARDDTKLMERPSIDEWSPGARLETPPSVDGTHYRWVREFVNGQPDRRNVQMYLRDGYTRVMASDLPDDFIVDEDDGDGFARDGGLILMKISEDVAKQIRAYYSKRSYEGQQAADTLQGIDARHSVVDDHSRRLSGADIARSV